MLGDVERSQAKRGAPVHLSEPVAGRELPDVAGLDSLAERRRHVVTDGRLRAERTWQAPQRSDPRIHTHDLAIHVTLLPRASAPPIARPNDERPERVRAAGTARL